VECDKGIMLCDYGTWIVIVGQSNLNRVPCNNVRGPSKVIMGPRNVIRGPWNVNRDRGM
jgi:hypothetical protein